MARLRLPSFICLALCVLMLTSCINLPPGLFGASRGPVSAQTIIPAKRYFTTDQIMVLDVSGVISIQKISGWFGGESAGLVVQVKDRLLAAAKNKNIKAIILRIDSPGGGVTASDVLYREILDFKKEAKIPVIAVMEDVAASGGLYVAMAADAIYAHPTAITGSIGVITTLPNFEGLSEKVGLEMRVIKSGKNKDLGSPWRSLSDEEKQIFQSMIDSMYERFIGVILENRGKKGLTREKLMEFADGRVLQADEAAKLGLIDGTGYMDDVIKATKKAAGIEDADIISYEYPGAYRGNIYAASPSPAPRAQLGGGDMNLLKLDTSALEAGLPRDTRFHYMWLP